MRDWARRLLAGAFWAGAGRGLALIGFAALAALLPLEAFGVFAHGRAAVILLGPLVSLGLAASVMRAAPQARDGAEAAGVLALGWVVALPVGVAGAGIWSLLGGGWMAWALPAYGALFFGGQAARALERPALGALPLGVAALAAAAGTASGSGEAAALWALSLWLAAAVQAVTLLAALPRPRPVRVRAKLAEAAPLTLSLAARGASWQAPLLLLPLAAGPETVGAFALSMLAAQAALAALGGIAGAAGPRLSAALARGDAAAARGAARAASVAGLAAALTLGLGAAAVCLALGGTTALAAAPAAWLAGAAALQALEAPLGLRLLAARRGRAEAALQAVGAAVAACVTLAAAPAMGAEGAGLAVAAGAAARLALAWRWLGGGIGSVRRAGEAPPPDRGAAPNGSLRAAILADHARLGPGRALWRDLLLHKTFRAVASYRLLRSARLGRRWWAPAAALWHRRCCLAIAAEIAWQAEIGPGLRLLHGFAVVILPCARIGPGATLAHGATLSYRARPEAPTAPISVGEVGAGAFVGPFAIVQARLGEGSVLAPHSVLREDAPAGWTVAGAPARPLRRIGGDRHGAAA